jgi:hypothetical protein
MPMRTADTTQEGASAESTADRLRAEQSASFQAEEFGRFFIYTRRLAEVSPGYARSYEFYVHCVLHVLAQRKPDLFFLQIGGMDGKRFDPIYAFVKHYQWKGLILEPLPDLFEALAANYVGSEGVTLVNAALTDSDGEHEMFRVRRAQRRSDDSPRRRLCMAGTEEPRHAAPRTDESFVCSCALERSGMSSGRD